jgi:hypothetical protein
VIDLFLSNEKRHSAEEPEDRENAFERPETTLLNPSHFVAAEKKVKLML